MENLLLSSNSDPGVYYPVPTASTKLFLASASNSLNPDLSGGRVPTASGGITKTTAQDKDVVISQNANVSYAYANTLSPFRRGAKIEVMLYISGQDIFPAGDHPSLIGFMSPTQTIVYWAFGIRIVSGKRRICFYGFNGQQNYFEVDDTLAPGWRKLTYQLDNQGIYLSVNEKQVFFKPVTDSQLSAFVNAQASPSSYPLNLFKNNSSAFSNTRTAWMSIQ